MSVLRSIQQVSIPAGPVALEGALALPDRPRGIVVFSHGSGSGRLSPRNQFVAGELHELALGTLLLDLLTWTEDRLYEARFDIDLLAQRLGVTQCALCAVMRPRMAFRSVFSGRAPVLLPHCESLPLRQRISVQ